MGFFAQFFTWLNGQLATYIGSHTAAVAAAIQPVAATTAVIYVMGWGYLSAAGHIDEPFAHGLKRMLVLAVILGVGIHLWAYHTVITDTFYNAPDQLAAVIVGAPNTISVVDQVWSNGNMVAQQLLTKGGLLDGDFSYYIAGYAVYALVGMTCVYTAFLLALSKIAIAVIVSLGPIFIVLLFFDATKRFFESWVAQLANYALVTILSFMVAALLLSMVRAYATAAVSQGSGITIAESVRLCIASVMVFLVMRQVMPIAAGLASGIALSSFNAVSRTMDWAFSTGKRTGYEFGRGMLDGWAGEPPSRWDSLRRLGGNRVGAGMASARDRLGGARTGGTLVPRERVMPRPGWQKW